MPREDTGEWATFNESRDSGPLYDVSRMCKSDETVAVATREVPSWWRVCVVLRQTVFFCAKTCLGNKELNNEGGVSNRRSQNQVCKGCNGTLSRRVYKPDAAGRQPGDKDGDKSTATSSTCTCTNIPTFQKLANKAILISAGALISKNLT